ncbi:MAG: acyl carrier protein [Chitinophagaceae bacterium]|nr:MAG: acyl carrier protein [Chitinophagaceae bacterium]
MERSEVVEKIRGVLVKELKHDKFEMRDSLTAEEVEGWDSLTHMVIITEIEKTFGVRFKLKELNKLQNMGDLINLVMSRQS